MWSLKSGQYEDLEGAAERILSNDGDKPIVKTRQLGSSLEECGGSVMPAAAAKPSPRRKR